MHTRSNAHHPPTHLRQQLHEGALHLPVRRGTLREALATDGINLIHEDDAGLVLSRIAGAVCACVSGWVGGGGGGGLCMWGGGCGGVAVGSHSPAAPHTRHTLAHTTYARTHPASTQAHTLAHTHTPRHT